MDFYKAMIRVGVICRARVVRALVGACVWSSCCLAAVGCNLAGVVLMIGGAAPAVAVL